MGAGVVTRGKPTRSMYVSCRDFLSKARRTLAASCELIAAYASARD